jgi:hypothetical protein
MRASRLPADSRASSSARSGPSLMK